jgi:hypothetical protein
MYEEEEYGIEISGAKVATYDSVNRFAFPAYRVFIYYQEVTEDVLSVNINSSGGSAERTPSSASITLANQLDKYIISTFDAIKIGAAKAKLNDRASTVALTESEELQGQYSIIRDTLTTLVASGSVDAIKTYLGLHGLDPAKFLITTDDGIELMDRETMMAAILEAGNDKVEQQAVDVFGSEAPNNVKYSVLSKKLTYKTNLIYDKDTDLVRYPPTVFFNYPYQKGDCIFNPNDPVRIAFRDPFDARVWYWKFSGFIDTWTENGGTNKESFITLNCTDVTKMARYTYTQVNSGILDDIILPDGSIDTSKADNTLLFYKQLFSGFNVYEVLEILFFGTESLETALDANARLFVAGLSDEEAAAYIVENYDTIKENVDLQNSIFDTEDIHNENLQHSIRSEILEIRRGEVEGRLPSLKNIGVISHPSGVRFKRRSEKRGVNIYVYGDLDETDTQLGAVQIKDLKAWNEIVHHRVRLSDLTTMAIDSDAALDAISGINTEDLTTDAIIALIGTNSNDLYPVGGGHVFYLSSSGLSERVGTDAIDKSFGGVSSMHSEFADDLTFIYDLAENIEYCFYATPKGDVIFEMPFYDFEVTDFEEQVDISEDNFDTSEMIRKYDELFQEAYSGAYTDAELAEMTNLAFKDTEVGTTYQVTDYSNQPVFNYVKEFTIEEYETYSFSNTNSDVGVCTVARSTPVLVKGLSSIDTFERKHAMVVLPELIPMLGIRVFSGGMLGYIDKYPIAKDYLGVQLNKVNAEARNLSIPTTPKFGLMVNRPVKWPYRSYSANIVSLSDSIVWNSSCDTTVSINQIRGWGGEVDPVTGKAIRKHFGGDRPFDLAKLLKGDDEDKE